MAAVRESEPKTTSKLDLSPVDMVDRLCAVQTTTLPRSKSQFKTHSYATDGDATVVTQRTEMDRLYRPIAVQLLCGRLDHATLNAQDWTCHTCRRRRLSGSTVFGGSANTTVNNVMENSYITKYR